MTPSDDTLREAEAMLGTRPDEARRAIERWAALAVEDPAALGRATSLALRLGHAPLALGLAQRFVAAAPGSPGAHHATALARRAAGDHDGAVAAIERALALAPAAPVLIAEHGVLLLGAGRPEAAAAAFERCLSHSPQHRDAHVGLGLARLRAGRPIDALPGLAAWAAHEPESADAWRAYGEALELAHRYDEAVAAREREVALDSTPDRRRDAGLALARLRRNERARELLADAAAEPSDLVARWVRWNALPLVHDDGASIERARRTWIDGLEALEAVDPADHPRATLEAAVASATPFVLHYHGEDAQPLQRRYGALVTRFTRGLAAIAAPRPVPRATGKLRIGFASAFFVAHTVQALFHRWLERLDRTRFTVVAVYLGAYDDACSITLPAIADEVVRDRRTPEDWVRAISAADLDVLVWLDVGMDGLSQLLASVRLAPVTAMAWGHPITSGLASVDAFLSGATMEPADGDSHYVERLVRLPNLGIDFAFPLDEDRPRRPRDRDRAPRLVCVQSVYKLHPRNLDLFARIAARLPEAELVFAPHASDETRAAFEARLRERFVAHGARYEGRVRIHAMLPHAGFVELLREADVFLDTLGWSGGHTTLEALATELPTVTLPGPYMRQRHTYGMLSRLGLESELAVADEAAYVEKVAALAGDLAYHDAIVARIRAHKRALYDDTSAVRGLERWLLEACAT